MAVRLVVASRTNGVAVKHYQADSAALQSGFQILFRYSTSSRFCAAVRFSLKWPL